MSCEVLSSKWTEFSWSSPFANSSSFFLRMRHQRHPIREYKYLSAKAIEFPIFARNTIITGKPTVMYAMNCNFPFVVVGTICPYPKIFYLFDGIMIENTNTPPAHTHVCTNVLLPMSVRDDIVNRIAFPAVHVSSHSASFDSLPSLYLCIRPAFISCAASRCIPFRA